MSKLLKEHLKKKRYFQLEHHVLVDLVITQLIVTYFEKRLTFLVISCSKTVKHLLVSISKM